MRFASGASYDSGVYDSGVISEEEDWDDEEYEEDDVDSPASPRPVSSSPRKRIVGRRERQKRQDETLRPPSTRADPEDAPGDIRHVATSILHDGYSIIML